MTQGREELQERQAHAQAAIVRTLSQELERLDPATNAAANLRVQLAEESGRLAFLLEQGGAPSTAGDSAPARGDRSRKSKTARPRVLIVDDDDGTRTALAGWLSDSYDVRIARDGAEALELAISEPPDAVLTDVWMPRLDGITMMHQMKRIDSLQAVPVLFLTGQMSPASVEAGISAGAIEYLEKPVDLDLLERKLRAALHLEPGTE